jgi:hypothetical protein
MTEIEATPWSAQRITRGATRMSTMLGLYVALPACWYAGIAADVSHGLWNWAFLDGVLVVPGVIRGLFVLLGG